MVNRTTLITNVDAMTTGGFDAMLSPGVQILLMKIAVGSDHAGFEYKTKLLALLAYLGHEGVDYGAYSDEATDYPAWIRPVAQAVACGEADRGIVLGGSGNGEAIVANRIAGVRCTLCWNAESARYARQHNDSNVLSMGAVPAVGVLGNGMRSCGRVVVHRVRGWTPSAPDQPDRRLGAGNFTLQAV